MIPIHIGAGIDITGWTNVRQLFPKVSDQIRAAVTVHNPEYLEARRLGRRTRGIDQHIRCFIWDKERNRLILPAGYLPQLIEVAKKHGVGPLNGVKAEVIVQSDTRTLRLAPPVNSEIKLRDYQVPAVEAMLKSLEETGLALLEAPPGTGKTEMALEIAARLNQKTLWITHTQDLAEQTKQRAISRLKLEPGEIGMLGAGRNSTGPFLTIGLVQTLNRMDLTELAHKFGCVIIDECHHSPATTWKDVLGSFAPRYKFGVTGTLKRADGLEEITHLYLGPTTYKIEGSAPETGRLVPKFVRINTDRVPEAWTKFLEREEKYQERLKAYEESLTLFNVGSVKRRPAKPRKPLLPYRDVLHELLWDEERNEQIVNFIVQNAKHMLVLSALVKHCEHLAEEVAQHIPPDQVAVIHGGHSKSERRRIIEDARSGKTRVLFSVDVAKEGLDVPILDQLFFVAGGKNPTYVSQAIGRIQRAHPGKEQCVVFDLVDEKVGVFMAQYWQRQRIYRNIGMTGSRTA